jgi:hypothetical protein
LTTCSTMSFNKGLALSWASLREMLIARSAIKQVYDANCRVAISSMALASSTWVPCRSVLRA